MSFCNKCGKELNEGAAFCTSCGAKITQSATKKSIVPLDSKEKKSTGKSGFGKKLLIPLLIIGMVCIGVMLIKNHKPSDASEIDVEQEDNKDNKGKLKSVKVEDCVDFTFSGYDTIGYAEWTIDVDKLKEELVKANKDLKKEEMESTLDALANKMKIYPQDDSQQKNLTNGDEFGVKLSGVDTLNEYGIEPANTKWTVKVEGLVQGEPVDVFSDTYFTLGFEKSSPNTTIDIDSLQDENGCWFSYAFVNDDAEDGYANVLVHKKIGDKFTVYCTSDPKKILADYGLVISEFQKDFELTSGDVGCQAAQIADIGESNLQDMVDETIEWITNRENGYDIYYEEMSDIEYVGSMLRYKGGDAAKFNELIIICKQDLIGKGKSEVNTRYYPVSYSRIEIDTNGVITSDGMNFKYSYTSDPEDDIEIEHALSSSINPDGYSDISKWYNPYMEEYQNDESTTYDYSSGLESLLDK